MTVDERGRRAAEYLEGHLDGTTPSVGELDARHRVVQRRRMRVGLAVFVVLVLVAVPAVLVGRTVDEDGRAAPGGGTLPIGTLTSGAWSSVPTGSSGLGQGSTVGDLVAGDGAFVAVGSRPIEGSPRATVWWSVDGLSWRAAEGPEASGSFTAVGIDGDDMVAVGSSTGIGGPADLVWASSDGGRSWSAVEGPADRFGPDAASMGRPFVTRIVRLDDRWLAVGGGSDGLGETWLSDDGVTWTPTFPENRTGGPDLAVRADGSVLAYWLDQAWTSTDGLSWSNTRMSLPAGYGVRWIADGAGVGLLFENGSNSPYTSPTPLVRSTDGGITWVPEPTFLGADSSATADRVEVVDGVEIVGGSFGGSDRPDAWAAGGFSWSGPGSLDDGQSGGALRRMASLGSRAVLMSGDPGSFRYLVVDVDRLQPKEASPPADDPSISRPGESARDLAERVVSQVFGEELIASKVEEVGVERLVTLQAASSRVESVATVVELPDGTFAFDSLTTGGLALDPRGANGQVSGVVSGPGTLTIIGLDGQLGSPEVMVDAVPVEGPTAGPYALVESSWLAVELRLPDGRVLRQLGRR
jgi:hypothetical protein